MLLLIGASFFVTDGVQGIAAGALRGLNDTRVPMLFAAVSFWLVGFTAAYGLAFPAGLGAVGVWIGFSLGVATFAALLIWRFHMLTARHELPPWRRTYGPADAGRRLVAASSIRHG